MSDVANCKKYIKLVILFFLTNQTCNSTTFDDILSYYHMFLLYNIAFGMFNQCVNLFTIWMCFMIHFETTFH